MGFRDLTDSQKLLCYKLKDETGIGMMKCVECLEYHNWNFEKAKEMARQPRQW